MVVYGTRPEAIKCAPVIRALRAEPCLDVAVAVTGQHRELLDGVDAFFDIVPDFDLDVGRPGLSLAGIGAAVLSGLSEVFDKEKPDAVLVHGDTTTSLAAAMAAYYSRIPVVHLEAGLRSGDMLSPWPEEGNRRATGQLASLHLAPTASARGNLLAENVRAEGIAVTGNTVIDALLHSVDRPVPFADPRIDEALRAGQRLVLLTGHRRESWDGGLERTARAIARVAAARPDVTVVAPLHPNPVVRQAIEPLLLASERTILTGPMDYPEFCHLLASAHCVITDSGGIQEEAPSLGKPVLVTRDTTERPEAIDAGAALLVGTDEDVIAGELARLLDDDSSYERMAQATNPYGDGRATERVVAALKSHFGLGSRLPDFDPGTPSSLSDDHETSVGDLSPQPRQERTVMTEPRRTPRRRRQATVPAPPHREIFILTRGTGETISVPCDCPLRFDHLSEHAPHKQEVLKDPQSEVEAPGSR
jgi:UDP-N-acetylglucosamine 2-epimerase (non-hydrolysing)